MSEKARSGVSRRTAIGSSLAFAAGAALVPNELFASCNPSCFPNSENWNALIGENFDFNKWEPNEDSVCRVNSRHAVLREVSVSDDSSRDRPNNVPSKTISLLFSSNEPLTGSNHQLFHRSIGKLNLMVSETADPKSTCTENLYEAILNVLTFNSTFVFQTINTQN